MSASTPQPQRLTAALSGRYRIERELGAGGMATVYLAHDEKHDRKVAIKVLRPEVAKSLGEERFLREIRFAAGLSHPNILSLFDSGAAADTLYYVMPNVSGSSLRDRMHAGPLPIDEAVRITVEVAEALDYAHRNGVVHRDIKPENIMLQEGHALVADFGIGKALGAVEGEAFTQTGASIGTPAYMSPEQAAGETIDGRSDVYSLGCVLYEMLVGEQPFTGPTLQAVIAKRFIQTPADVSALRDGVTRSIARAVQQSMARTPIDRFESAAAMVSALRAREAEPPKVQAPEKSIAVLPFANLSADPENEYFADGITEDIIGALAQISALRVAGRTSSFSYKGKSIDVRTVAEQLNVRTVLEGSVRRAGKRVRVTAQLTDVADGFQLWSERYDRDVDDVFALQDEIARTIAERMKASLAHDGEETLAIRGQRAPSSIEAYEAYIKGRSLLYKRGNTIPEGMALMRRALEIDPNYGLAWSGLADAFSLLGYYAIVSPEEAGPQARDAALRAVEVAPDLAEAHTSLGLVRLLFDWDWVAAESAFLRAMTLNPQYHQGVAWYWLFYRGFACGEWQVAIDGITKVYETDTRSAYLCSVIAIGYSAGLADPRALEWAERAMALEPTAYLSVWTQQMALAANRRWADAIAAHRATLANSGRQTFPLASLSRYYIETGELAKARSVFLELESRAEREYTSPFVRAMVAANIGERERALELMEECRRRKDPGVVIFGFGWNGAEGIREMPEFQQLLRDIDSPGMRALSGATP